jgi:ribosomal protein S1
MLGFIPSQHASDSQNPNWKNEFKVGQRVSCRVLVYNEEKNRLYMTAKPSLVSSMLPRVTEFKSDLVGKTVIGMAFNPFESGAFLVQFYNNLAGFLPSNEAKKIPHLKEGDVVRANVVSVDLEKRRILLTLREDGEKEQKIEQNLDNKKVSKITFYQNYHFFRLCLSKSRPNRFKFVKHRFSVLGATEKLLHLQLPN